jgi:hypothetical protein
MQLDGETSGKGETFPHNRVLFDATLRAQADMEKQ